MGIWVGLHYSCSNGLTIVGRRLIKRISRTGLYRFGIVEERKLINIAGEGF